MITRKEQTIYVATDVVIFTVKDNQLQVLLIQMIKKPYQKRWACPGGLVKNDEKLDIAVKRILKEQTSVGDLYLEQLYTFGDPKRDPSGHVVSVAYFALINSRNIKLKSSPKYAAVKWFPVADLPNLAYDHNKIVEYAQKRLRWKLEYTNVAYSLIPAEFTFSELRHVYEAILGQSMDKRNFRKRMLALSIIEKTDKQLRGQAHRPAYLYRFCQRKPEIIAS